MFRLGSRARTLDWGLAQIYCQAPSTTISPNPLEHPALNFCLSKIWLLKEAKLLKEMWPAIAKKPIFEGADLTRPSLR